jgi:hypothetical protein
VQVSLYDFSLQFFEHPPAFRAPDHHSGTHPFPYKLPRDLNTDKTGAPGNQDILHVKILFI